MNRNGSITESARKRDSRPCETDSSFPGNGNNVFENESDIKSARNGEKESLVTKTGENLMSVKISEMLDEIGELRDELISLEQEKADLEIRMETNLEHSDFIESELLEKLETKVPADQPDELARIRKELEELGRENEELGRIGKTLAENEKRLRLITETIPVPVIVCRLADSAILYANNPAGRLVGMPAESLLSENVSSFFDPAGWQKAMSVVEGAGSLSNYKLRGKRPGGYFQCALSAQKLAFDGCRCLLVTFFDLTELRRAENKYRTIFEDAIEGIFQCAPDGRFLNVNPSMARILGFDSPEEVLSSAADIAERLYVDPGNRAQIARTLLKEKRIEGFETRIFRKDGTKIWASVSARTVADENGDVAYYEGFFVDITERKRAEKAEREREAAEAASRAKSYFLAKMCHEIRTPMNAILGMADLLWESSLNPDQKKYVRIFQNAGEGLLALINDILDMSKVEAGQVVMETIGFNLVDVVEKTCEVMALKAHEKNLEIMHCVEPETPVFLEGDPNKLGQILSNLLSNALKFTHKGEIFVDVYCKEIHEDPASGKRTADLLFSVKDTGVGVPLDMQATIFEIFAQKDASVAREYGGTGLGLAICKRFVEMMGGRIWIESDPGKGSLFYFSTRFGIQSLDKTKRAVSLELNGIRSLIVDDNMSNRSVLRKMLEGWGAEADESDTGEKCLELLSDAESGVNPYRLVFLDNKMPGMNGFETAIAIRERFGRLDHVIMMLATNDGIGQKAMGAGISEYLVKPVKRGELEEAVKKTLNGLPAEIGAEKKKDTSPPPQPEPLRILLVEDNKNNRMLFSFYLKTTAHTIDIAENGRIGYEKYVSGHYDIIFMDLEMPVMGGYEATRMIRKWESDTGTQKIPIIALTAHAMKGNKQECLDAGCTDYVTKPFKKERLLNILAAQAPEVLGT